MLKAKLFAERAVIYDYQGGNSVTVIVYNGREGRLKDSIMDFNSPEDAKEYFDGVKGVVLPKRERAGRGVRV